MHISKLELFGFKSFAKKQTILLNSGVTGIVGPNGCGKTNIVDAIRWVLGEQKTSRLRSTKMEDVIFNGASNIKPLGLCEVFLTVQNDKGLLPVEYEEVEIGRRLYRNGDSEYFINRTACRLKDIYNLFVDTGMSSDAYSVIELNMIEQILSDKDNSRRSMFEEAAGINKYKSQRRSALRKFELNSRDLERIDDIILEIEMQVKSLELQLKRFKRHEKLSSKLKDVEINLASAKITDLEKGIKPLESLLKKKNTLLKKNTSKKESESVELKDARSFYLSEKEIVEKMKVQVDKLTENLLKEVQTKNRESSKGMEVLEGELQKKISQLNKFDKDYIKIVSNNDVTKSLSNESREKFKTKNYTVIETDKKYENLKASIEDYKDKIQSYNKEKEFDFNKIDDSIKEMQEKINLHKLELRNKKRAEIEGKIEKLSISRVDRSYRYLLDMPVHSLTKEKWEELQKKMSSILNEKARIEKTEPREFYRNDLKELKKKVSAA